MQLVFRRGLQRAISTLPRSIDLILSDCRIDLRSRIRVCSLPSNVSPRTDPMVLEFESFSHNSNQQFRCDDIRFTSRAFTPDFESDVSLSYLRQPQPSDTTDLGIKGVW